ncbi:hypothetical protein MNBD_GAMMA21-2962 [hydrothermal vent metagenome]|uniref:Addiction module component n=1 Tax=hydrothermal vent metagenome TaxID=652676 RepID=A0A3B0ZV61_9ZZZZ
MARNIEDIEKELMALPTEMRERIAHDLFISLDKGDEQLSREEWEAAWLEEVKKRDAGIENCKATLATHEEVMASLKTALKN